MANYCPKCGARNLRIAVVCEKCGTLLVSGPVTPNPNLPFAQSRALDKPEKTFLGIVPRSATGIIIGMVILAIGILLCIYSLTLVIKSVDGAAEDPFDTVIDIFGGFMVLILGAILAAIGGTICTIGMIWFLVKMLGRR
ncbi:MAG TPA: zinc-ribbon domain-containing protein [Thermoplasmata archaeon]